MKCDLDDLEPSRPQIGDNVAISYGCYFSLYGKGQTRTYIKIENGANIGIRSSVVAREEGKTIGAEAIIGASSLVILDVAPGITVAGVPA